MELKINTETPSDAIVKSANASITVTDSTGRTINIRRLKTLDRLRLLELVGAENSKNEQYIGYAALAYSITAIDEVPVPRLSSKLQLEALVQRLDDHGFDAVAKGISEHFKANEPGDAEAKEAIKNG